MGYDITSESEARMKAMAANVLPGMEQDLGLFDLSWQQGDRVRYSPIYFEINK